MGVEKSNDVTSSSRASKANSVNIYRPPALRRLASTSQTETDDSGKLNQQDVPVVPIKTKEATNVNNVLPGINVQSNLNPSNRPVRRERRPDRAVYVPRARRSQTTPPQLNSNNCETSTINSEVPINNNISSPSSIRSHQLQSDGIERKINNIDSTFHSTPTNREKSRIPVESTSVINNCDSNKISNQYKENAVEQQLKDRNNKHFEKTENHLSDEVDNIVEKNQDKDNSTNSINERKINMNETKDTLNDNIKENKMSLNSTLLRIEDAAVVAEKDSKEDKEIKELEKASKEINRTSRRIIKQTFNSDILEIPETIPPSAESKENVEKKSSKIIDPETDDWETMFDDNGECIDPKIIAELTASVGKVKIDKPKADYKAYHLKQSILNDEEFPHVLEISNFPVEFRNQDLFMIFSAYKESGFDIKWVDDTHALAVFSSSRMAAEALALGHPFVLLKPLAEATVESRSKARKCSSSLQPYRPRPETCAALARRLVTGALGVRLKTAPEERENEKRVLREAKERKLLAAKQRDEAWES